MRTARVQLPPLHARAMPNVLGPQPVTDLQFCSWTQAHSECVLCTDAGPSQTLRQVVWEAYSWESAGWRNFWRGNMLNCVRTAPFKAVNYTAFDYLNGAISRWRGGSGGGYERFLAGAGAGMFATVTCMPLDIVRTRMMAPRHTKSLPRTVLDMISQEGMGSFYTGCLPALVSMAVGGATFYGTCAPDTPPISSPPPVHGLERPIVLR